MNSPGLGMADIACKGVFDAGVGTVLRQAIGRASCIYESEPALNPPWVHLHVPVLYIYACKQTKSGHFDIDSGFAMGSTGLQIVDLKSFIEWSYVIRHVKLNSQQKTI